MTPASDADVAALVAVYEARLAARGLLEAVWADGADAVPVMGQTVAVPAVAAAA